MTLPQPTAVAAAVSGGIPTDVREWIAVDIIGSPSVHRRGYAVYTEPLDPDGHTSELARQVRDVLLHELRLHPRQAPDAALARAFGVANSLVYDDARLHGGNPKQIGATAVVFEGHTATIAHVPPGQLILIQDHLVYGVPDLDSRLPYWAEESSPAPNPEPLGYSTWTAPLLVQTELMPGDTVVLCNDATARVLAKMGTDPLDSAVNMRGFHGQDPDEILDTVRAAVLEDGEPFFASTVISFPPNPVASEIESLEDVARSAREQARHAKAAVRSIIPTIPTLPTIRRGKVSEEEGAEEDGVEAEPEIEKPKISLQERLIRITEGRPNDGQSTWRPRRPETMYGAPGAHGVRRHRRITGGGEGFSWKSGVPRAPFVTSPIFVGIVLLAIFLLGALIWNQRDIFLPDENVYVPALAQVDQRLNAVETMDDPNQIRSELDTAQSDLERAEDLGAPSDLVEQRQVAITLERDEVDGVLRVSGVSRIGSLPEDLHGENTSAFMTSGGIFLANGNLYRLNPESAEMQMMLEEGREIEGVRVGSLFGVAYDGNFLVVTDGRAVFFASSTDGAIWQSMQMEEINNQGPWEPGPIAAFNEQMYLLAPEFRNIYTFATDANQQVVAPADWVSIGDRVNLNIAVDMTIDGNIYVLLEDGQVVTYRSGLEIHRYDLPGFDFRTQEPKAIVRGPTTGYVYVVVEDDDGGGRVIATDVEGENAVILELPTGFSTGGADVMDPFEQVQDIVVDEPTGTLYIINGDAVWSFQYTLPALELNPNATPEAADEPAEWATQKPGSSPR